MSKSFPKKKSNYRTRTGALNKHKGL